MQTGTVRLAACGVWVGVGAFLAAGGQAADTSPQPQPPPQTTAAQSLSVSLTLEQFVGIVLANHPDLDVPLTGGDLNTRPRPSQSSPVVVRSPAAAGSPPAAGGPGAPARPADPAMERLVNATLLQAIEAYWDQFRRVGEVRIREKTLVRADLVLRRATRGPDANAPELTLGVAETFHAEARIALHEARRQAASGEDHLKFLMNDELISIDSNTALVLVTEPPDPPGTVDIDATAGIAATIENRLGGRRPDRTNEVERRAYETLALEVKTAWRRVISARAMFALARVRSEAAQKALDAVDARRTRAPTSAGLLLARIRVEAAFADAQSQLLAARVEYQVARAAWDRAIGELLERWGITIEPAK